MAINEYNSHSMIEVAKKNKNEERTSYLPRKKNTFIDNENIDQYMT